MMLTIVIISSGAVLISSLLPCVGWTDDSQPLRCHCILLWKQHREWIRLMSYESWIASQLMSFPYPPLFSVGSDYVCYLDVLYAVVRKLINDHFVKWSIKNELFSNGIKTCCYKNRAFKSKLLVFFCRIMRFGVSNVTYFARAGCSPSLRLSRLLNWETSSTA